MAGDKYREWLEPEGLVRLEAWARDGLALEQIAHNCGCSRSTLANWRRRHSAIAAALKRGREVADILVENALYKRALGFTYTETVVERGGKDGEKVRTTTKQAVPDVSAQIFWLRNRRPGVWRDKPPDDGQDGAGEIRVSFGEEGMSE